MTSNCPIRVLHVVPSMSLRAGMTSVVMNYHRVIDPDKVHFDYLYINPPEERIAEAEALGARVWRVPFTPRPSGFSAVRQFFSQHAGEFDIVHCHQIFAPEMVGHPAKRFGAKRVVAHSHATRFSDKQLSAMRNRFISHFVGMFATDYMACSDAARVLLGRHGADAYILHNAIDCKRFAFDEEARFQVRSELGVPEKTLLLGTLGRLENQKNQLFLPEVVRVLEDRQIDCFLVIACTGSLRDRIIAKSKDLGVSDRIKLVGDRSDAPRLYSAFDAFLLPSLFEGLPVSGVEAQVSGLPCIISDAITREVAFGVCTFAPLGDAQTWADAVMSLPRDSSRGDGPLLAREAGFDIAIEASNLVEHYQDILWR